MIRFADTCPICNEFSLDNAVCKDCKNTAREYLQQFEMYKSNTKEQLYELLRDVAEDLEIEECKKRYRKLQKGEKMIKAFDMVEYARELCLGKR